MGGLEPDPCVVERAHERTRELDAEDDATCDPRGGQVTEVCESIAVGRHARVSDGTETGMRRIDVVLAGWLRSRRCGHAYFLVWFGCGGAQGIGLASIHRAGFCHILSAVCLIHTCT
jgi:hypothetical protein